MKNNKHKIIKALKILGKIIGGILILLILILLFIRSPWGQGIIKDKFISSISKKTNTELSVDKLFINFAGNLQLDGLYAEDKKGDTLIYSKSLEADIDLWPLIQGTAFSIDNLDWEGVTANISRKDSVEGYNYQFLMDAIIPSDTTSTPQDTTSTMAFNIGSVDLKDIKLNYDDKVSGIDSKLNLGKLSLEMNKFDLDKMDFRVDNAELSNTRFRYVQTKPFPDTPPKEKTPMPYLVVDKLALNDVKAYYESQPDGILLDSDLQHFVAEMPLADLPNNTIKLNQITLNNSDILVKTTTQEKASGSAKIDSTASAGIWPEYTLTVDNIDLENDNIRYFADSAEVKKGEFNPNALAFQDLNLQAKNLYLKNKTAGANIQKLNFSEGSGIDLNQLAVELQANDESFSVNGLDLAVNGNKLKGELAVQYDSLQQFVDHPEKAKMALDLPEIKLDIRDIYRFQPSLQQNPYMQSLGKKTINGSLTASGIMSKIDISRANFNWGASTRLAAQGVVKNATNPDALAFDFPQFQLSSTKSDLGQFLDEAQLGIDLPQRVKITGNFSGTPEDMKADAYVNTSEGDIDLKGNFSSGNQLAFNADVQVKELAIGKLLKNKSLGKLNLSLSAKGQGTDVNSLDATMEANISSFQYNKYEIKDLKISGDLEDGA
ncbi:MAG: translocation/assembly module TamB, partial [Salegentibacter sp.]